MPVHEDSPSGCVLESHSSYEVHENVVIPFDYVRSTHGKDSVGSRGDNVRKSGEANSGHRSRVAKVSHRMKFDSREKTRGLSHMRQ